MIKNACAKIVCGGVGLALAATFASQAEAATFVTATQVITIPAGTTVPAGSNFSTITAMCPSGYTVTGGGFQEMNQVANNGGGFSPAELAINQMGWVSAFYFMVFSSAPTAAGDGWTVTGQVMPISPVTVTVYARCMM